MATNYPLKIKSLDNSPALETVTIARILNIYEGTVYVRCPFCNKTHRHGYTNDTIQFRSAHCCGKDYSYDPWIYNAMRQ